MKTDLAAYADAVARHHHISMRFLEFSESKGEDQNALKHILNSVPPGLYEHWKSAEGSPKFYAVFGAGCELDLHTPLVAHVALYGDHAGELTYRNLIHPERGFLSPIRRDKYQGPRYTLVEELTLREIAKLLDYIGELKVITNLTAFRVHVGNLLKRNLQIF